MKVQLFLVAVREETVVTLRQCAEVADCSNALVAWRHAPGNKRANATHFRGWCS